MFRSCAGALALLVAGLPLCLASRGPALRKLGDAGSDNHLGTVQPAGAPATSVAAATTPAAGQPPVPTVAVAAAVTVAGAAATPAPQVAKPAGEVSAQKVVKETGIVAVATPAAAPQPPVAVATPQATPAAAVAQAAPPATPKPVLQPQLRAAPAPEPSWTWTGRIGDFGRHFFATLSVAVIVKAACMVGNLLVQVSPIPQVQDWEGKGSTGSADAAPYVSMALGGFQWCTYGLAAWVMSKNDGFLVLVYANCLGAVLGCYYSLAFYRHCRDTGAGQNMRQYVMAVVCLLVVQSLMWLSMSHARALMIHSLVAGGCSFMSALSLVAGLPVVLRTGDTSGICGPLVIANFGGAFLWAYWGWLMNDPVVISTNMFAAFASSMCLYVKYLYQVKGAPGRKRMDSFSMDGGGRTMGNSWGNFAARKAQYGVNGEEWQPLVPMKH